MASELAAHRGYILEIRGFADATGPERYNFKLGRERADAVVRYLLDDHNVPTSRVATVSYGEESPVADNTSRDGRAQNRRVQVRLLEVKPPSQPVSMTPEPQRTRLEPFAPPRGRSSRGRGAFAVFCSQRRTSAHAT